MSASTETLGDTDSMFPPPLLPCAPWCADQDGHPRESPVDRRCWSRPFVLPLRTLPVERYSDGSWSFSRLDVRLQRKPVGRTVVLVSGETSPEVEFTLTVDDARMLIDALTAVVDIYDRTEGGA